jgi:chromosome partitioning protein
MWSALGRTVIVAFLNRNGGVGKTRLALHMAGARAEQGEHIVVLATDPQGSALEWSHRRGKTGPTRLFNVIEFARPTVHKNPALETARASEQRKAPLLLFGEKRLAIWVVSAATPRK